MDVLCHVGFTTIAYWIVVTRVCSGLHRSSVWSERPQSSRRIYSLWSFGPQEDVQVKRLWRDTECRMCFRNRWLHVICLLLQCIVGLKPLYTCYIRHSPIQICANVKPLIFASGVCIKEPQTATSAGAASKKLVYRDQVVELTYESGDACAANPSLKHKSIFSFVCKSEGGGTDEPVLVYSDDNTCTHLFSWHTPLVCEQQVTGSCNVLKHAKSLWEPITKVLSV